MSAADYILDYCHGPEMVVGRHRIFVRDLCEDAFPPTGEKDHRPAGLLGMSRGEFTSLALAFGGHRPDVGQTTKERMERALNAGERRFEVLWRPYNNGYEIYRTK